MASWITFWRVQMSKLLARLASKTQVLRPALLKIESIYPVISIDWMYCDRPGTRKLELSRSVSVRHKIKTRILGPETISVMTLLLGSREYVLLHNTNCYPYILYIKQMFKTGRRYLKIHLSPSNLLVLSKWSEPSFISFDKIAQGVISTYSVIFIYAVTFLFS